ncbi:MAG: LysR family transcriptional regulator [Pigmentiphaga sp.]
MNISIRQLKAFLAVARLNSFTRAAEHLHITQQGLSLMIQEVERQFGSRLFDRTTRRVGLTAAGRQLVLVAGEAVSSLEAVASSIDQLSLSTAQTLSVAATPFIAAVLMPDVCMRFRQRHPEVAVRVIDVERNKLQPLIEAGEADLGFGIFLKPTADLHRRVIFQCDMVCVSPAPTRTSRRRRKALPGLRWADLADVALLGLPGDNIVQQVVDAHLPVPVATHGQRPVFNNIPTILGMVEAGFGSAILPSFSVAALDHMHLEAALMEDPIVPIDFYQINLKGRHRAEAESLFVETLLETLKARCTVR